MRWSSLEPLGEAGDDPPGQRDVAGLDRDAGRRGVGLDHRQQRVRRQRRGLVGVGVDDGRVSHRYSDSGSRNTQVGGSEVRPRRTSRRPLAPTGTQPGPRRTVGVGRLMVGTSRRGPGVDARPTGDGGVDRRRRPAGSPRRINGRCGSERGWRRANGRSPRAGARGPARPRTGARPDPAVRARCRARAHRPRPPSTPDARWRPHRR